MALEEVAEGKLKYVQVAPPSPPQAQRGTMRAWPGCSLGVTGGIAAYKACELVRLLVKAGHDVVPLPTPGAERFVSAETFFARSRAQPRRGPVPAPDARRPARRRAADREHAREARARARRQPRSPRRRSHIAGRCWSHPAMNPRMWEHPATQANVEPLRARGVELIGPDEGELAEGESGLGRMAEPEEIFRPRRELLGETPISLARARACSSAQAGRASRSTRCGSSATAPPAGWASRSPTEARRRGAEVTLLAANLAVPAPRGIEVVETPTAADLEREALARRGRRRRRDGRRRRRLPAGRADRRRSGRRTTQAWRLELEPTVDVLALARRAASGTARCSSASPPSTARQGLERARRETRPTRTSISSSTTTCPRTTSASTRPTTRSSLVTRAGERRAREGLERRRSPPAIVDEVERLLRGASRGGASPQPRAAAETVERLVDNLGRVVHAPRRRCASASSASSPRGT